MKLELVVPFHRRLYVVECRLEDQRREKGIGLHRVSILHVDRGYPDS